MAAEETVTKVRVAFLHGNTSKANAGVDWHVGAPAVTGHPCRPLGMWLRCHFPDPLDKVGGLVHTPLVSSMTPPQLRST